MTLKTIFRIILVSILSLSLFSCAMENRQQQGTAIGAGVGVATGAMLGQAIGRNTESTVLGAAIGGLLGGLAGNQVGAYMDRQEQDLRSALAYSEDASIQREQDVLTATFKSDLFFDYNSATLKPGAYAEIDRIANVLNRYPQTRIRVEGHTDNKGSETYNQQLSERRAGSVANALIQRGIDPRRLQTIGYGETRPISSSDAMNRRVNVVIIPMQRRG